MNKYTKRFSLLIIAVLIVVGFGFRYLGISQQLSYWNDESHTALKARNIVWDGSVNSVGAISGIYQVLFYYLTAGSFKMLGINEIAGRLPSVVAGTGLIWLIYWIANRLFKDERKALLAALLVSFSQIQLAWSTQLRPYIWLEVFTLLVAYFCYQSLQNHQKTIDGFLVYSVLVATVASLFHGSGLVNFVLIGLALLYKILMTKRYIYLISILPIVGLAAGLLYLSNVDTLDMLLTINTDLLHYRIFLTHHYWWLLLGVLVGMATLWNKNKQLAISLATFIFAYFMIAILKINGQYVRYSVPVFPLMYFLFASGLVDVGDKVKSKIKNQKLKIWSLRPILGFLIIGLSLLWPVMTSKILLWPKYYYSINADMRENPIVDYKRAFEQINQLINNQQDVILMDAWHDRIPWYLPGQRFIFLNEGSKGEIDPIFGEKMIGTVSDFEQEKSKHHVGIVIVEDWPSKTPPELQDHIRKTLKHEFDVQDLPYNEGDHWGISVYSWGLDT